MNAQREVRKELTLWSGTALAINAVIGAGVFSLAGLAVENAGPVGSWIGWLTTSFAIAPFVYIFYALCRRFGSSGSLVKYATEGLGPWSNQSVSLILMGTYVALMAVVAIVGGSYVQRWFALPERVIPFIAFGILVFVSVVNLMGTVWFSRMSRVASVLLALIIAELFFFYFSSAYRGATTAFAGAFSLQPADFENIGSVSALLFLAMLGWESMSFAARECKDAKRTMPGIFFVSYALVVAVYLLLASVVTGLTLEGVKISGVSGLIPAVVNLPLGRYLPLAMIIVVIGNASAWTYVGSRMLYSASTNSVMCPAFSRLNKQDVPHLSIFYMFFLSSLVLLVNVRFGVTVASLVKLANQNFMVIYLLCLFTFWKVEKGPSRWIVGVPALCACGFFLSGVDWQILYTISLAAIGFTLSPMAKPTVMAAQ